MTVCQAFDHLQFFQPVTGQQTIAKFQGCGVIAKKKIYNVGLETPKLG